MNTARSTLHGAATRAHNDHVVHRLAHAIYGLIVLVAVVGEFRLDEGSTATAIAVVGGGATVLVIAHSYSQVVAVAAVDSDTIGASSARPVLLSSLVDQLALAVPAAVAVGMLALGDLGVIAERTAYNLVLVSALATLFGLGVGIGAHRRKGWGWRLLIGLANTAVGLIVIGVEAAAHH